MIHLDTVIRNFGAQALRMQLTEFQNTDNKALEALRDKSSSNRGEVIRNWLQIYQVFQGIEGTNRRAIASAVLEWADARDIYRDLTSVDALDQAHTEMTDACLRVGGKREFTSLASKALWLCYPDTVPLYDSFAQRALWVISKLEKDLTTLPENEPEYKKFVFVWRALYDRYAGAINSIDIGTYPYRVRIFDKILWLLGERRYSCGLY